MPKQKKGVKKGLTEKQLRQRLGELSREAKRLDAKIERLKKARIGTVRVI